MSPTMNNYKRFSLHENKKFFILKKIINYLMIGTDTKKFFKPKKNYILRTKFTKFSCFLQLTNINFFIHENQKFFLLKNFFNYLMIRTDKK